MATGFHGAASRGGRATPVPFDVIHPTRQMRRIVKEQIEYFHFILKTFRETILVIFSNILLNNREKEILPRNLCCFGDVELADSSRLLFIADSFIQSFPAVPFVLLFLPLLLLFFSVLSPKRTTHRDGPKRR
jgi:hypothetical protein